jgi:hypothetical protein
MNPASAHSSPRHHKSRIDGYPGLLSGLLAGLRAVLDARFSDGTMTVRYETMLWIGTKR